MPVGKGWASRKAIMAVGAALTCVASGTGVIPLDFDWAQLGTYGVFAYLGAEGVVDAARELRRTPQDFDLTERLNKAKAALEGKNAT